MAQRVLTSIRLLILVCGLTVWTGWSLPAAGQDRPDASLTPIIRVNCGAAVDYSDEKGRLWHADRAWWLQRHNLRGWGSTLASSVARKPREIPGTPAPLVYLRVRSNPKTFDYYFKLPPGSYHLRFHFAETYPAWDPDGKQSRIAVVSGSETLLGGIEPVKEAGGFARPLVREVADVRVEKGVLHLGVRGTREYINGIEILARDPRLAERAKQLLLAEGPEVATPGTKRVATGTELREALAAAGPGTHVVLEPGVYRGMFPVFNSGTPEAPIVIEAAEPGTVVFSNAASDPQLDFTRVRGGVEGLYSAGVPRRVRWLQADGRNLADYGTRANLKALSMEGHDTREQQQGPPEGFAWEEPGGQLYVRLIGGADPNESVIEINAAATNEKGPPVPTPARLFEPGSGIHLAVAGDHVTVRGLRFHIAPDVAFWVAGNHVTVSGCAIDGAHCGIVGDDAEHLTVENCVHSAYPAYQWLLWGAWRGGQEGQFQLWNTIYNSNLNSTFVDHRGTAATVRSNLVYECWDALKPEGTGRWGAEQRSEYAHNLVLNSCDEAIEFDSNLPHDLRVHHNVFINATAIFGISPVFGDDLLLDHNLAYQSPDRGPVKCTVLKIARFGNSRQPIHGCTIVHNTLVNPAFSHYWPGGNPMMNADNTIANNLFHVYRAPPWKVRGGFSFDEHNLMVTTGYNGMQQTVKRAEEPGFAEPLSMGREQQLPPVPLVEAGLAQMPAHDYRPGGFALAADSPAVDAGRPGFDGPWHHGSRGRAPDCGAIERGAGWRFPRPGPDWWDAARARTLLPLTVAPRWLGFGQDAAGH